MTRSYKHKRSYVRKPKPLESPYEPTEEDERQEEIAEAEGEIKGAREALKDYIYRMRSKNTSPISERWRLYKGIDRRLEEDKTEARRKLNVDALAGHTLGR